eukprot:scaffold1173_cov13-Tisochrysis_lutea.AAC.1
MMTDLKEPSEVESKRRGRMENGCTKVTAQSTALQQMIAASQLMHNNRNGTPRQQGHGFLHSWLFNHELQRTCARKHTKHIHTHLRVRMWQGGMQAVQQLGHEGRRWAVLEAGKAMQQTHQAASMHASVDRQWSFKTDPY